MAESVELAKAHAYLTVNLLVSLGFVIKQKKSVLIYKSKARISGVNNNNNKFINLLKKAFQLNLQCQISKT